MALGEVKEAPRLVDCIGKFGTASHLGSQHFSPLL